VHLSELCSIHCTFVFLVCVFRGFNFFSNAVAYICLRKQDVHIRQISTNYAIHLLTYIYVIGSFGSGFWQFD